jgi:hypothetical protein
MSGFVDPGQMVKQLPMLILLVLVNGFPPWALLLRGRSV